MWWTAGTTNEPTNQRNHQPLKTTYPRTHPSRDLGVRLGPQQQLPLPPRCLRIILTPCRKLLLLLL